MVGFRWAVDVAQPSQYRLTFGLPRFFLAPFRRLWIAGLCRRLAAEVHSDGYDIDTVTWSPQESAVEVWLNRRPDSQSAHSA